jgi:hypothetical protein
MTDTITSPQQQAAEDALLAIIADAVQGLRDSGYEFHSLTSRIHSLAASYRLVVGGEQSRERVEED